MIRRRHLLAVSCIFLAAVAFFMRARAGWQQGRLDFTLIPVKSATAVAIQPPRDFVLHPDVAAGEETLGPRRIISLAPSLTETLCALGLADRLVGRTQFCTYPPQVASAPAIGGIMDTNIEMIRALEPDLVLTTSNSGGLGEKLKALGMNYAAFPHSSLEDMFVTIERVGVACGRPQTALRLAAAIRADLRRLADEAASLHTQPKRVLMACGELPVPPTAVWVAGPGLFLDTLLRESGHENAANGLLKSSYGEIPLEKLVVLDPDVILTFPTITPTQEDMIQIYRSWSPMDGMQAIRRQRVRIVGGPEWLSAGPRAAVELHRLITVLSEFN